MVSARSSLQLSPMILTSSRDYFRPQVQMRQQQKVVESASPIGRENWQKSFLLSILNSLLHTLTHKHKNHPNYKASGASAFAIGSQSMLLICLNKQLSISMS